MINRMRISVGLMMISILLILAFQSWWLRKSYLEEAGTLRIRTGLLFRETVHRLQVSKLKLDSNMRRQIPSESDAVGVVNVLKEKIRDSLGGLPEIKSAMVFSLKKEGFHPLKDSVREKTYIRYDGPDRIFDVLIGSDSLQDSITIREVNSAYQRAIKSENIEVPFYVEKINEKPEPGRREIMPSPVEGIATIGFLNPVTYKLHLADTTPYLLKKIAPQSVFSFFLLGITIVSFLSLYRNLLAQQKLAVIKNEFISNITHELKTPIATVSVAIEALRNFNALDDPGKTREYLDISQNELQRLSLLVDKVLKLSMFEKKEIELKVEPVDLRLLVEEVTASMRLQLEKYHAKLSIESEGDTTIEGDRLHFISVIFNLLDNALKYSKANPSIQIKIKATGEVTELSVTDNGIGIPGEY